MRPMAIEIRLPDIGDFKNVPIIEIHVKPGHKRRQGQPLMTLESDKATLEVPAPGGRGDRRGQGQGRRQGERGRSARDVRAAAPARPRPPAKPTRRAPRPLARRSRLREGRREWTCWCSAPGRAATPPRSAPPTSAKKSCSSRGSRRSAASASTSAAFRRRRCCMWPR